MRFKQAPEGHWMPVDERVVTIRPDQQPAPIKPYSEMTDEQLTALAAERGIDMTNIRTRAALIKTLEKAEQ